MTVAAFPLSWPEGFPRSKSRASSQFKTSLPRALDNVESSLKAFGRDSGIPVADITLSSNVSLGDQKPDDPGVAAWFRWDGEMRCIAVDRYPKVEDNLQAIHHVLEARRTELRHGTLAIVRAAMSGLKALPAPKGQAWREVLELKNTDRVTAANIQTAHRRLAALCHPDKGGSNEAMATINAARDAGLKEIGA